MNQKTIPVHHKSSGLEDIPICQHEDEPEKPSQIITSPQTAIVFLSMLFYVGQMHSCWPWYTRRVLQHVLGSPFVCATQRLLRGQDSTLHTVPHRHEPW